MLEWLVFLAPAVPFSDSPQIDPQQDDLSVVVSEQPAVSDSPVKMDLTVYPQCCGLNPLPPPGAGQ